MDAPAGHRNGWLGYIIAECGKIHLFWSPNIIGGVGGVILWSHMEVLDLFDCIHLFRFLPDS